MNSHKILVPLDFSNHSFNALKFSGVLAHSMGRTVELLHIIPPKKIPLTEVRTLKGDLIPSVEVGETKIISTLRQKADEALPKSIHRQIVIRKGSIEDEILKHIDESEPACVVMGHAGENGVLDSILGSMVEHIVRESPRPVISCLDGFKTVKRINKILIPVDPDFGIENPLALYEGWFKKERPEVQMLSVVPGDSSPQLIYTYKDYLEKQKAKLIQMGAEKVDIRLTLGDDPADAIFYSIQTDRPDFVMMNTHGRGSLSKLFQGSVAEEVLNRSLVPVLTSRPERQEPEMVTIGYHHSWFPI